MHIKKRSLPVYILLNCLTLGIYGFVVSCQMGKEVDALCRGDGERPKLTYAGALLIRGIAPILGIIFGLIAALVDIGSIGIVFKYLGAYSAGLMISGEFKAMIIFLSMTVWGLIFTLIGSIITGIYLKYWWYKQAGRLNLNGYRYGLTVRETGTDIFLFRTVIELILLPITLILVFAACALPLFIVWLVTLAESIGAYVFAFVLLFVFSIPLMLFGCELTTGAYFSQGVMFRTLGRYANVYRNGAQPFDLMGYSYYPSVDNKYPNFLPGLIGGQGTAIVQPASQEEGSTPTGIVNACGMLVGISGSCAGYKFELTSGEEIVIGKDAKVASVVIDPAFKEISRKHVSVCYDVIRDQYFVVDYSSNGTWANGSKLITGQGVYLPRGTELKLANDKNIFRLG